MNRPIYAAVCALCLFSLCSPSLCSPSPAQAADAPALLNTPDVKAWSVYGPNQTNKYVQDKAVKGGGALTIKIQSPTQNVWDIGASLPVTSGFHKGDHIVVAVYARSEANDLDIPAVLQGASAPYPSLFTGTLKLTPQWRLLEINGTATADTAANQAVFALSLGGDAKAVDLGPAFILDQGQ